MIKWASLFTMYTNNKYTKQSELVCTFNKKIVILWMLFLKTIFNEIETKCHAMDYYLPSRFLNSWDTNMPKDWKFQIHILDVFRIYLNNLETHH